MRRLLILLLGMLPLVLSGCGRVALEPGRVALVEVARSSHQWTGVAVGDDGRIYVNYPRWSDDVPLSVAVLEDSGGPIPYPNRHLNQWQPKLPPRDHFVCVQSVVMDDRGSLWILDPANPNFAGVVPGGPKLLRVDAQSSAVLETYRFEPEVAPPNSYLNDVRVDTKQGVAYITDSGAGAIIVTNLADGKSRRLLSNHPSTQSEGVTLVLDGKAWKRPDGGKPEVHADGIALSPDRKYLYYQALTGRTLYRVATRWLNDPSLTEEELGEKVEMVGVTGPADGIEFGPDGNLYLTAIEQNAIRRWTPDGRLETLIADRRLAWPDSLAFDRNGELYVTTSQIHRAAKPGEPYRIFKITAAE